MSFQDEEYYITKIIGIYKANLNAKLLEIDAEKNDGLVLKPVDANAYYYLTFGPNLPAYDPVCIITVNSQPLSTNGGISSERVYVAFQLVVSDGMTADSELMLKTMSRYRRAIKEIAEEKLTRFHSLEVERLPDAAFVQRSLYFYTIGIGIQFSIAY